MSEKQKTGQGKRPWWGKRGKPAAKPVEPPKPKGNYAFIDSQNLNLGVQKMGWKMDWHKLRLWLAEEYGVTHAYMFIGYMQENESLYEQMYAHGFLVVLKPTLEIKLSQLEKSIPGEKQAQKTGAAKKSQVKSVSTTVARGSNTVTNQTPQNGADDKEKTMVKGNIDADLVLYAMKELPNYDKAVIISGDGDFFALVEYLIQQKKLLKLLTPNKRFSTLLQEFDEYIVGIEQHRSELSYRDFRKQRKHKNSK